MKRFGTLSRQVTTTPYPRTLFSVAYAHLDIEAKSLPSSFSDGWFGGTHGNTPIVDESILLASLQTTIGIDDWSPGVEQNYDEFTRLPTTKLIYAGTMPNTSPVPVPGALWLFGTGIIGLAAKRRLA